MTDPIERFRLLFGRALATDLPEPTAVALATATSDGQPSVRMVLLKHVDEQGFVFYTNLESRKAAELEENPRAALCFHWPPLAAQVRIEGRAGRIDDAEADNYFATRPRDSQIGAWASLQSRPLSSHEELETRVAEIAARYGDGPIPRPPFWSGFRLVPHTVEFWSGRPGRLHERERFTRDPHGNWTVQLLYP
jgi:pyridoxamine 5'-phosphate oxidase